MRTIASASADLKGINYLTRIETGGHRLIADEPSLPAAPMPGRPRMIICSPVWRPAR